MDRIAFLLGAGASKDAGLPLTGELTREVGEAISADRQLSRLADLYTLIVSAIIAHNGELGVSPYSPLNIERVVSSIRLVADRRRHEAAPFVRSWTPAIEDADRQGVKTKTASEVTKALSGSLAQHGNAGEVARALSAAIQEAMLTGSGGSFIDLEAAVVRAVAKRLSLLEDVTYLEPLTRLARLQGVVDIATLNYDLAVERHCEDAGVDLHRGIDNRDADRQLQWGDSGVNLYKLHGSIDWQINDRPRQRDEPSTMGWDQISVMNAGSEIGRWTKPAIVLGDREKLESLSVTLDLMADFSRALRRARRLIVVGYSFSDPHINRIVANWMDTSEDRTLTVVDPGWARWQANSFQQRVADVLSEQTSTGLRGHLVQEGTRTGLQKAIDDVPDDPAARAFTISYVPADDRGLVTLSLPVDHRVQMVAVRAGLPGAFDHDFGVSYAALYDVIPESEMVTADGVVVLPSITEEARLYESRVRDNAAALSRGEPLSVVVVGFKDHRRSPGRVENYYTLDLQVTVSYAAGAGVRVWSVTDGVLGGERKPPHRRR